MEEVRPDRTAADRMRTKALQVNIKLDPTIPTACSPELGTRGLKAEVTPCLGTFADTGSRAFLVSVSLRRSVFGFM